MYTTEQFNNDVQKLRDLMNKCEELEKKKVIKLGTNVKSLVHDDLEGSVVVLDRSNDYAVIKSWITDYEFQTVECYLSDLEAV